MGLLMLWNVLLIALLVALHFDLSLAQSSSPRSIVSQAFFEDLLNSAPAGCQGKSFYSYDNFISAAETYAGFGTTDSDEVRKREVAAFLANVMHETGALCHVVETDPKKDYCDLEYPQWPCTAGKQYIGRGPLQLSWNYNYGAAGQALGFDGLNNPEIVAQDPSLSFKTATWFWMRNSNCHTAITTGGGFGGTISAINNGECNGGEPDQVNSRVDYYRRFCEQFGVDPGPNISC